MIKQYLQTTTLPSEASVTATVFPSEEAILFVIVELQEFIVLRPNAREVRKALAVKLVYQGYLYEEIQTILDASLGSITAWKQAYEQHGIDGLRLNYKCKKSDLSSEQREQVLQWLQTKEFWEIGELEYKLAFEYDVIYESKQSYYEPFKAAGISWKKTTKQTPKLKNHYPLNLIKPWLQVFIVLRLSEGFFELKSGWRFLSKSFLLTRPFQILGR